jgi:hypothetical protein
MMLKDRINRLLAACACFFLVGVAHANSLRSIDNGPNQYERAILTSFPIGFGAGEFTFEIAVKLDNRAQYPIGLCGTGGNVRLNWCSENHPRYGFNCWWCNGNFLIDGVNFAGIQNASFSLQMYDGGRVRWLIGDGDPAAPRFDEFWSVGNAPNANNPRLLDGNWHLISVVRRFAGASGADLEMWIDGVLIDSVRSGVRTNLATTWEGYADGFAQGGIYGGWFFFAEKQAVNVPDFAFEDYKGQIDEVRFWNRAKTASELSSQWRNPVAVGAAGLSGYYDFSNATATQVCDRVTTTNCMRLANPNPANTSFISTESASFGTVVNPPTGTGTLDIDGSGAPTQYDANTDGVLLLRYLRGTRGAALIANARGATATRDAAQIEAHIAAMGTTLDVDANGSVQANFDGVLISRYLRGLRGAALVSGTRVPAASAPAVESRIRALMP